VAVLISTLVLVCIGVGLWWRRVPTRHWPLMLTAFTLDLGLVVYLEGSRNAVERALSHPPLLVQIHAAISVMVLACWVAMIRLGWLTLHRQQGRRRWHRGLAVVFVTLRITTYVTSLWLPPSSPPSAVAVQR
jgi:uncharacterized membrane protein YozB (DUF420 family)